MHYTHLFVFLVHNKYLPKIRDILEDQIYSRGIYFNLVVLSWFFLLSIILGQFKFFTCLTKGLGILVVFCLQVPMV